MRLCAAGSTCPRGGRPFRVLRWSGVAAFAVAALLLHVSSARAQWWNEISRFGQNKVNYEDFEWQLLETEHFRVYFYQGEAEIARIAAQMAEDAYARISRTLNYKLSSPVPILIYDSHNDFEQTNATWGLIDEGTLGFTEAFKNRVVLPFTGSYTQFRHVIHHELVHAVMFDMFYRREGGLSMASRLWWGPPLWFAEGLAEYCSTDWTSEKNMWVRGAVIDGYLELSGFQAYTAGYALLRWIAEEFGPDKIAAITRRMAITKDPAGSFRAELGISLPELEKRWERHLKRTYWPEVGRRELADEIAKRLTDHQKDRHFYNYAPAIAPQGDRIAFLSDRDGYASIFIMSAIDGRVIRKLLTGEKSAHFEEMHWLRSGISWSPDGTRLTIAAKNRNLDVLYLVDAETGAITRQFRWEAFNSLYSPTWSPDTVHIAFVGVREGRTNLYAVDLRDGSLAQLTEGLYDVEDPDWSPDGTRIAFTSDREPQFGDSLVVPVGYDRNVFVLDVATRQHAQVTVEEGDDLSPSWSPDGRRLAFTSDRNGIYNLYVADLDSGTSYPITDVLNGVFYPDWSIDGRKIAFTAFGDAGYDIYVMGDPLGQRKPGPLAPAEFMERRLEDQKADSVGFSERPPLAGMGQYAFSLERRDSTGAPVPFRPSPYRLHFSPDLVTGLFLFDNINGLTAQTLLLISDTMGDHQIFLYTNITRNVEDADFQLDYVNQKRRTTWGFSLFQYHQYYLQSLVSTEWTSDRIYGLSLLVSRPFDKYTRVEGTLELSGRERQSFYYNPWNNEPRERQPSVRTFSPTFTLVNDNTLWGYTGPANGSRSAVKVKYAPAVDFNTYAYTTVVGDWRRYFRIGGEYAISTRVATGGSFGRDPGRFLVGGMNYWINFHYASTYSVTTDSLTPITQFITPLRGARYGELAGSRFGLVNLEFRYPLVRQIAWGWPIPIVLRNVRGILFLDVGTVWGNGRRFAPFVEGKGYRLNYNPGLSPANPLGRPLAMGGFGFGWRLNLGVAVLKWDIAWPTDLTQTLGPARQYWTLGADF